MSSLNKKHIKHWLGVLSAMIVLGCLPFCNKQVDRNNEIAVGNAGEIRVFYPKYLADSVEDWFINTAFAADSNLIRFEENRSQSDPQYYESMFNFDLQPLEQAAEIDPQTNRSLQSNSLLWILDPQDAMASELINTLPADKKLGVDLFSDGIEGYWFKDVWAKSQVVLILWDQHSAGEHYFNGFSGWLKKHQAELLAKSKQYETAMSLGSEPKHHPNLVQNQYTDSLSQLISAKYNISLSLDASMKLVQASNDFIWLRYENSQFHSNLMVNIYPMNPVTESLINAKNFAINQRDSFTKKYLKTAEGTWVETSKSGIFPLRFTSTTEGKTEILNVTGWYNELNTNRRGPFIRKIIKDTQNQRYVAIDGFLFAPNQPRLRLMRELEIMVAQSHIQP